MSIPLLEMLRLVTHFNGWPTDFFGVGLKVVVLVKTQIIRFLDIWLSENVFLASRPTIWMARGDDFGMMIP